jgi:hypothetical protein
MAHIAYKAKEVHRLCLFENVPKKHKNTRLIKKKYILFKLDI